MAVDVQPASPLFAAAGLDPATIPASFNIPSRPSWHRLICWLLSLGQRLPVAVIPDAVDLYTAWSLGMVGLDSLTPSLLAWLYRWLTEIETARDTKAFRDLRKPFGGELDYDRIRSLESDLRTGFLLFCNRTPSLAAEYLRSVRQRQHSNDVLRSILKFRGSLAQAAPAELAELTAAALIQTRQPTDTPRSRREIEQPFDFLDHDFIPASPAQGPFLELLTHACKVRPLANPSPRRPCNLVLQRRPTTQFRRYRHPLSRRRAGLPVDAIICVVTGGVGFLLRDFGSNGP